MKAVIYLIITLLAFSYTCAEVNLADIDPLDTNSGNFFAANLDSLSTVAKELYKQKDYLSAARYYLAALEHQRDNTTNLYNLACCYGLLNQPKFAAKYLQLAVASGYENYEHILNDPDFDPVREAEAFVEITKTLEKKGASSEFDAIHFFEIPTLMRCAVILPDNYNPKKIYDIVIGLHGWGDSWDRFLKVASRMKRRDFIFAVPQATYAFGHGDWWGFSWTTGDDKALEYWKISQEKTIAYLRNVIIALEEKYPVKRKYIIGFSQGAGFTFLAGINHYDLIDGIIPMGGWLDEEALSDEKLEVAKSIPVYIIHGKKDKRVEYSLAEEALDRLRKRGYRVKLHSFNGGHTIDPDALTKGLKWIRKQ
ncbi:MAG: dienelactone hydrolase family protein [Candidatus Cloacimonetes bacterium]|nr:dienelactone hydrolase family protein [Candidatus Cloacimonadota bacterium]